jgi:hypothetical protein
VRNRPIWRPTLRALSARRRNRPPHARQRSAGGTGGARGAGHWGLTPRSAFIRTGLSRPGISVARRSDVRNAYPSAA